MDVCLSRRFTFNIDKLNDSQPRYLKLRSLIITTNVLRNLLIGLTLKIEMILNGLQKRYLKMTD